MKRVLGIFFVFVVLVGSVLLAEVSEYSSNPNGDGHNHAGGIMTVTFLLWMQLAFLIFIPKHRPGQAKALVYSFVVPLAACVILSIAAHELRIHQSAMASNALKALLWTENFFSEPVEEFELLTSGYVALLCFESLILCVLSVYGIASRTAFPFAFLLKSTAVLIAKGFVALSGFMVGAVIMMTCFPEFQDWHTNVDIFSVSSLMIQAVAIGGMGAFVENCMLFVEADAISRMAERLFPLSSPTSRKLDEQIGRLLRPVFVFVARRISQPIYSWSIRNNRRSSTTDSP